MHRDSQRSRDRQDDVVTSKSDLFLVELSMTGDVVAPAESPKSVLTPDCAVGQEHVRVYPRTGHSGLCSRAGDRIRDRVRGLGQKSRKNDELIKKRQ